MHTILGYLFVTPSGALVDCEAANVKILLKHIIWSFDMFQ